MTVYTLKGLTDILKISRQTAYEIMRGHGFRVGYGKTSSYRITEEAVREWIHRKESENESLRSQSSRGNSI